MSTTIAFLSGKGGSGKTTLALSAADLLCRCGVRTLLTDCDLSTNGATYFYEGQLSDHSQDNEPGLFSFSDLFRGQAEAERHPLTIRPGLDFMPSIPAISDQYFTERSLTPENGTLKTILGGYMEWARKNYDVILFDCQAGYADFMPELLPLMDVNLFVLEPDSISASAMRNLHLKIGRYLGRKPYQIFNKATPEEYEIYSKIEGTFFTNIGTLLFDWKIRQAFSRSRIPDLENASAKYGAELCDICQIILKDDKAVMKKLNRFSNTLKRRKLEEHAAELAQKRYKSELELGELISSRKGILTQAKPFAFIFSVLALASVFSLLFLPSDIIAKIRELGEDGFIPKIFMAVWIVAALLGVAFLQLSATEKGFLSWVFDRNLNKKEIEQARQSYEDYGRSLDELRTEIKKLDRQISAGTDDINGTSQTPTES
ncbi:MAG: AAA family ATPase [Oscillibacter sp.]|nr:AAA family ATPase [Oscillibacter sp.]